MSKEQKDACTMLMKCLALRAKHIYRRADYYWGPLRPGQFPAAPRPEIIGGITCDVDVALIHPSPWRSCPSSLDLAGSAGVHPHGAPHAVPPLSVAAAKSPASTDVPVDSAAAASSRAPAKLESMFYRRRPVPHWRPFEVPPAPPMAIQFRAIDGVIHVFDGSSFLASPAPDSGMIAPDSPSVGSALDESQLTSDNAMFPCSTWDEWQRDYFEVSKVYTFSAVFAALALTMLPFPSTDMSHAFRQDICLSTPRDASVAISATLQAKLWQRSCRVEKQPPSRPLQRTKGVFSRLCHKRVATCAPYECRSLSRSTRMYIIQHAVSSS